MLRRRVKRVTGSSTRLSAWATQRRRNVAAVASRWRHSADLIGPRIEPQTSRTDSVRLATELTFFFLTVIISSACWALQNCKYCVAYHILWVTAE